MNKIWTFAWKEFLLNIRSARFLVGLLLCLVIVPFTMMVSVNVYKIQTDTCRKETAQAKEKMDSHVVWSSVRPLVVKQPESLSLLGRGISDQMGYSISIQVDAVPVLPFRGTWMLNNPFMKVFPTLDFSGVLGIMLSLLALIFSYDAVTREREEGTLRFIFSSSGSRFLFLLGKWLGVMLTVVPMVVFCYALALGFVGWGAGVSLSSSEWAGVGWMILSSLVYLSLFAWMGIFVSALNVYSVNSVVVCMLCWLCFLFVIPSLTSYVSRNLASATTYERVESQKKESWEVFWKEYRQAYDSIRLSLEIKNFDYLFYRMGNSGEQDIRGGSRLVLEHTRRMGVRGYELGIEHADRCWKSDAVYLRELLRQRAWQDGLGLVSPSATFTRLMSGLCYTDASTFQEYMDEVREYRVRFLTFLRERNIVSSISYVTPMSESEFMDEAEWKAFDMERKRLLKNDPSALEALMKEIEVKYQSQQYRPVDTAVLPRFTSDQVSGWRRFERQWPLFCYLCLISLGFMGGAIYVFGKYDLR